MVSMLGLSLLSCSGHAEEPASSPSELEGYTQLVNKTQAIPDGYLSETARQGEVVRIDYDTRDYGGTAEYGLRLSTIQLRHRHGKAIQRALPRSWPLRYGFYLPDHGGRDAASCA